MKKVLLVSVLGALALAGCKKEVVTEPVCDIAKKAAAGAAAGVAGALGCANVSAVEATLTKPIDDLKICSSDTAQGLVGDLVCGQVSKFVTQMGVSALPAEWGCTGGAIGDTVETTIMEKCKQAINF